MAMLKRKGSGERCAGAKRPALQRKQHLYLLVDDWDRGYSVRKLDIDALDDDDTPKRFAEPPVARIEAAPQARHQSFVSNGTKILAMQPGKASPAIPVLDTRTLGLSLCPWPTSDRDYGLPLFASAAGKLFVFMDVLTARYLDDSNRNSWTTMDARPPFYASRVVCHAMHPDGRTLFVSAADRHKDGGTFSLDTETMEWTRHGSWLLPFAGEAYFDAELDAWVGLYGDDRDKAGRLCSCDVEPVAAEFTRPPSWKLGKDRLFRNDPERHIGAKLVYMGGSRFCLVEFMFHKDDVHLLRREPREAGRRRVLDVTAFGLKYSKEGQLCTTLRRARSCNMYRQPPEYGGSSKPVAFWL